MGFELLQPFLEAVFTLVLLAIVAVVGLGFSLGAIIGIAWTFDKMEDFADRMEASWNVKP